MEGLAFIQITEDRLQEILDVYNYFVLNTTVSFDLEPITLEQLKTSVMNKNPRFQSFAILEADELKGYVLVTQHKAKPAYDVTGEITIYLNPAYVNQGIGSKALHFIEDIARKAGFHSLVATICTENERSIYLFKKHGYSQCAYLKEVGYKFNRWLDIVVLQKILAN
ncbi:GNAT family N-acetyltransferase [Paenibacillus agricola]|uniref:N-acetyltransferase n=1 Tax=Paenibacillus agricola TaxID=2716264 RepID=A0ABX0J6V3_9BACL|nr:GNAT family N-acetyltransferase [Paenibacillus agricola]NHN31338.1 N-acetyltransferase [Paenibacillus agricola]